MNSTEKEIKLFEAIADISYIAGYEKYYSGDSRIDIKDYLKKLFPNLKKILV